MTQTALFPSKATSAAAQAAPVLKWAGGKGQLLPALRQRYPSELFAGQITTYAEPFVGGGAVFFDIIRTFSEIERVFLFDVNPELIVLYTVIKLEVDALIDALKPMSDFYLNQDSDGRKDYYYRVRTRYNATSGTIEPNRVDSNWIERAAQTIFLNKTGFNGLFRVNRSGHFNVPAGRNGNPDIVNEARLLAASAAFERATIRVGDFSLVSDIADAHTFVYYDPPYRPISPTSSFKSYMKNDFDDGEQQRLAEHFRYLSNRGVKQLLSNSDPANYIDDPFFDELYAGFIIERVHATRMINSKATGRGPVRELLIRNYET